MSCRLGMWNFGSSGWTKQKEEDLVSRHDGQDVTVFTYERYKTDKNINKHNEPIKFRYNEKVSIIVTVLRYGVLKK